jgi:ribosome biogenesis protein BRX1
MARKRRQDAEPEADVETEEEHPGSCDEEEQEEGDDELVSSEEDEEEADDDDDDDAPSSSKGPAAVIPPPLSLLPPSSIVSKSDGRYHNRRRLLVLSSRGITARYRHFLEDLRSLIPHSKKECKLDVGKNYSGSGGGGSGGGYGAAVNEIAEVRGCHAVLFLECRKRGQDGYLWLGRTSHSNDGDGITTKANGDGGGGGVAIEPKRHLMISGGPSVKFHITNIHTMDELKMTGNCMKGSRPVLSFDTSFDTIDHLKLIKHLFVDVFGTPRGHPKSKPFVDRVMGFYYADGKVRDDL